MQSTKRGPTRPLVIVVSLLVASLAVVGVSRSTRPLSLRLLGGSPDFSITGSVSGLGPGNTSSTLTLTVTDNLKATMTVTAITAQITSATYVKNGATAPSTCVTYLNPTFVAAPSSTPTSPYPYSYTWTGLNLQPTGSGGQASVTEPFAFGDKPKTDQSSCEGVKFAITYSGSGSRAEVYATSTGLSSSQNPSLVNTGVTYTAKVTASATASQDPVPSSPTGTVTFKDGSTTICTVTFPNPGTAGAATSTATCSPPVYTSAGTHSITAAYADTQGNFNPSSAPWTQTVQTDTDNNLVSSLPGGSVYGQNVTFTDTLTPAPVPSGQTVTFHDGTTVIGTGTLNAGGKATFSTSTLTVGTHKISASYAGNGIYLASTSNTVTQVVKPDSCVTGTQNGGLTVPPGQAICVANTGKVNGNVTVNKGGFLYLYGGTINGGVTVNGAGSFYMTGGTVNGNIVIQSKDATFVMNGGTVNGYVSSAGAKTLQICGALNIGGTVTASGTTSYVVIGDGAANSNCTGNKINGAVTLTNNTAGVEVSLNNITGNLTLTGNTGGTVTGETANEVEANKVTGNLACTTNSAAPINDGKPNTVSGSRTGQCAGF